MGLIAIALMLCLANTAEAQKMYRWVDEQGRVHYGDRPPPGKRQELRKARDPSAGQDAAGAEVSEACRELEQRLASYRSATELVEQDALGNKRSYTPEQRAQLIARTEEAREQACATS